MDLTNLEEFKNFLLEQEMMLAAEMAKEGTEKGFFEGAFIYTNYIRHEFKERFFNEETTAD